MDWLGSILLIILCGVGIFLMSALDVIISFMPIIIIVGLVALVIKSIKG